MTSHWPTFADGLFWCACDNRTFATQDEWQEHVADAVIWEWHFPRNGFECVAHGEGAECCVDEFHVSTPRPTHVAVEQPQAGA